MRFAERAKRARFARIRVILTSSCQGCHITVHLNPKYTHRPAHSFRRKMFAGGLWHVAVCEYFRCRGILGVWHCAQEREFTRIRRTCDSREFAFLHARQVLENSNFLTFLSALTRIHVSFSSSRPCRRLPANIFQKKQNQKNMLHRRTTPRRKNIHVCFFRTTPDGWRSAGASASISTVIPIRYAFIRSIASRFRVSAVAAR